MWSPPGPPSAHLVMRQLCECAYLHFGMHNVCVQESSYRVVGVQCTTPACV